MKYKVELAELPNYNVTLNGIPFIASQDGDGIWHFIEAEIEDVNDDVSLLSLPSGDRLFLRIDEALFEYLYNLRHEGISIEPYIRGIRATLHSDEGKDFLIQVESGKEALELENIKKEASALRGRFILSGVLRDYDDKGTPIPLIDMGRTKASKNLRFFASDILFLDGTDYRRKTFLERREALEELFEGKQFSNLRLIESSILKANKIESPEPNAEPEMSISGVNHALSTMGYYPSSEGIYIRSLASEYSEDGASSSALVTNKADLNVIVFGKEKTKEGNIYQCGILIEEGFRASLVTTYKGNEYVLIGQTLPTPYEASQGEIITVSVTGLTLSGESIKEIAWKNAEVIGSPNLDLPDAWENAVELDIKYNRRESIIEAVKPAFGSPGGKKLLSGTLVRLLPEAERYVEPFIGGGAVFWKKDPSEAEIINDLDPEIAAAYRILKKSSPEAIRKAAKVFDWKANKKRWESAVQGGGEDNPNRLMRFLYALRNSMGWRRTSFVDGDHTVKNKPPAFDSSLEKQHERLQSVTISEVDFRKLLSKFDETNTVFYLDPPFEESGNDTLRDGKSLSLDEFASAVKSLKKAKFLASYADTPEARKAFKDFNIRAVKVSGSLDPTKPKERKTRKELIIANFDIKLATGKKKKVTESLKEIEIEVEIIDQVEITIL